MALIAPARMTVNPSFTSPRFLLNNAVRSGMRLFPGDGPDVKLTEGAKAVYVPVLDLRTLAKGSQTGYNELPSVSIKADYITTPAYEQKVRVSYDREDLNAASNWNISLASAYTMAMRQAHFQLLRDTALFGFNPQNGEGLINSASGTVRERLQADSNGRTTLDDYDPGQALQSFLRAITGRLNACNLLGISAQYNAGGPPVRVVFLAPQRVLGLLASRIVWLYVPCSLVLAYGVTLLGGCSEVRIRQQCLNLRTPTVEQQQGAYAEMVAHPELTNIRIQAADLDYALRENAACWGTRH